MKRFRANTNRLANHVTIYRQVDTDPTKQKLNDEEHKHKERKEPDLHASLIPIVTKPDDDSALLLRQDGLVDRPSRVQMRQKVRHSCSNGGNWKYETEVENLEQNQGRGSREQTKHKAKRVVLRKKPNPNSSLASKQAAKSTATTTTKAQWFTEEVDCSDVWKCGLWVGIVVDTWRIVIILHSYWFNLMWNKSCVWYYLIHCHFYII